MTFAPVDSRLLFSRNDPEDPRLGDFARAHPAATALSGASLSRKQIVLAGYPDDEGISINGGRRGAADAPDAVRLPLYKMTPPLVGGSPVFESFEIFDLGNLDVKKHDLGGRHEAARLEARRALEADATWVSIGGGHDYGFADAAAYIDWAQARGERPLVLNFDAHLDVRPTHRGLSSGTPFFRMLEAHPDVDFAEIGIQAHCNSKSHLEWAQARGVRVLTQEEVTLSGERFSTLVTRLLGDWLLKPRSVFLSIDIDGFSSSVAPGCSQSWATGFLPAEFFACLEILKGRLEIRALGVYEVSPALDLGQMTSKLAAQIIHRVIT